MTPKTEPIVLTKNTHPAPASPWFSVADRSIATSIGLRADMATSGAERRMIDDTNVPPIKLILASQPKVIG